MLAVVNDSGLLGLVIVALLSGTVGAVATGFFRNRHERAERLKERRLDAADGLVTTVIAITDVLTELTHPSKSNDPATIRALQIDLSRRGADLVTNFARVQLLFGRMSDVGNAAALMTRAVAEAVSAVQGAQPDFAEAAKRVLEADPKSQAFVDAANKVIV